VNPDVIKEDRQTQKNSRIVLTGDEKRLYRLLKKLEKQTWK